jgi:transposase-like protein
MKARFTQSFKIQAVEKALSCPEETSLKEIAENLGVGYSTLGKWIAKANNQELETVSDETLSSFSRMPKERRPQDWSLEERLNMVITCGSPDKDAMSQHCRTQGIYPHHIKQWQQDFMNETQLNNKPKSSSALNELKRENKALKKELRRKDKALAETAALLVLQKKVNAIWGNDE